MKIYFNCKCHTIWGQQVYVTGSIPKLGNWDKNNAIKMNYFPGDEWRAEIGISSKDINFEYKYVIKTDHGWILDEGGNNRICYLINNNTDSIELRDTWFSPSDPENVFFSSAFCDVLFKRKNSRPGVASNKNVIRLQIFAPRVDAEHTLCVMNIKTKKIMPMDCNRFPLWALDLFIEDAPFRYKYAIRDKNERIVFTEEGSERVVDNIGVNKLTVITDEDLKYPNKWRGAGIAIPVFSVRTKNSLGVGEFTDLKLLADWAGQCGFKAIQILPVNDTSLNLNWMDSYPYSGLSVFALHPLYLNIQEIGELPKEAAGEIDSQKKILNNLGYADYMQVILLKMRLIGDVFEQKKKEFLSSGEFKRFFEENSFWLRPYAAFCMMRDKHKTSDYKKWGKYAKGAEEVIRELTSPESTDYNVVAKYYFMQYHLHLQLLEASLYCRTKGIVLKGDIPIGICKHSDSCWISPEIFNMNQSAGAPPDPFSFIGQNWQFPTYNWEEMGKNNYLWWRQRLKQMSDYFHMVRLDHVLGFFRIWEIPDCNKIGLMGHFNPAIPVSKEELEGQGIWDFDRLCEPHIPLWLVRVLFAESTDEVKSKYLDEINRGLFRLKQEFSNQRLVEEYFSASVNSIEGLKEKTKRVKDGLFFLISNIVLFRDPDKPGFHPRINMMDTPSFECLDGWMKEKLKNIYYDYYYHRQDDFWTGQAMVRLPVLKDSSRMLICGEDLGMIPDCVPAVMERLCILGLRIQRMPRESDREFGYPDKYPYLTVCTTSSHDMSTMRGWWEEDRAKIQRYYNNILGHKGDAPAKCNPEICKEIIVKHLESPSVWAIFPVQDILGMSEELCRPGDPREEQINVPGDPHHYWKFRLHINLEELISQKEFSREILEMVENSGRNRAY